jgi:hypothetical protein
MLKIYTLLALTAILCLSLTPEEAIEKGILQIQPSALDSLRNYFDVLVIFLKKNHTNDE